MYEGIHISKIYRIQRERYFDTSNNYIMLPVEISETNKMKEKRNDTLKKMSATVMSVNLRSKIALSKYFYKYGKKKTTR